MHASFIDFKQKSPDNVYDIQIVNRVAGRIILLDI